MQREASAFDSHETRTCACGCGLQFEASRKSRRVYFNRREGEVFGLEWGDLDFNSRLFRVQHSWVKKRMETPKNGQLRRIDMSKQLAEVLEELPRWRETRSSRFDLKRSKCGPPANWNRIFHASLGQSMDALPTASGTFFTKKNRRSGFL